MLPLSHTQSRQSNLIPISLWPMRRWGLHSAILAEPRRQLPLSKRRMSSETERASVEKLYIQAHYYDEVTVDNEKSLAVYAEMATDVSP